MSLCDTCCVKHNCVKHANGYEEEGIFCIKNFKMNSLYNMSLMREKQRQHRDLHIDADGTDKEMFSLLKQYEDHILDFVTEGRNLYIYSSNCGNGKTSWSLRLAQSYLNKIWYSTPTECKVLFINVPKFFIKLKDNIGTTNEYITHIKKYVADCDLVVWDDIGTKVGTEFEVENLLNIINNRIDNGKSNIYTSNIQPEELRTCLGDRLYSRVVNMSSLIHLQGKDKRGLN